MAISGFVGAGVQDALSQQLAEQLRQAMFEEEQRQAQAREAMAAREQTRREAEDASQREHIKFLEGDVLNQRAAQSNAVRDAQVKEQTLANQRNDAALVHQMPGMSPEQKLTEIAGPMARSGGDRGIVNLMELNMPAPKKMREVTVRGQRGEPINRMVPEDEAVQEYRDPPKPTGNGNGRVDIRTVQQRGQNGEPGFATLVYRDGILESSHWSPGNPSAAERQGFGDFKTVEEAFRQARDAYKPELVGPVQGRIGNMAQVLPGLREPAGFTDMKSKVAAIQNQLLYLRSGKAISEQEFARMMKELPTETDKDQNFLTKLNNAESLLKTFIENRKAAAGVPTDPVSSHGAGSSVGTPTRRFNPATGKLEPVRE